jgi:drug/metabolite transporter (DMT)-like permease
MLGAIATTFCFAVTPVFANRAAHRLGSLAANFWRLAIALLVLGAWVAVFGSGCPTAARTWFVLGGVAGFGVGGIAMFLSLPRLGSSLSTLLVQCLSAIVAAAVEFAWLGQSLTSVQIAWAAGALAGVTIGLLPRSLPRVSPAQFRSGVAWAVLSAVGQGTGAVLSRKAFAAAAAEHALVDPGTAAFLRVVGGLVLGLAVFAIAVRSRRAAWLRDPGAWPWVLANALAGPVLGVACYQWALRSTPAGIVQPIVAIAPLLTIPFAAWIERAAAPRAAYYAGSLLAIGGATGLALSH